MVLSQRSSSPKSEGAILGTQPEVAAVLEHTLRDPDGLDGRRAVTGPGLILVFSDARPCCVPFPLREGRTEIGRAELEAVGIVDDRASRRHLAVDRDGLSLSVSDLGSTNGVFLNGVRLPDGAAIPAEVGAVVRVGRSLFVVVSTLAPYQPDGQGVVVRDGIVLGPTLRGTHQQVAALAGACRALLIRGESGAGKEIAARVFHDASPRRAGPLVAVNCATIPKDIAERLLFGTVKGAYSGAVADASGYLQAANNGTLFLDEVAELDLAVQAKLLRVLETREVVPLGATRGQPVDIGLCAATLKDLAEAVASRSFREDLFYRIGRPEVRVPPLRERREEISHLIDLTVRAAGLVAGVPLVEDCLLRPWPGNVRELCAELRAAVALAAAEGSGTVLPRHLGESGGRTLGRSAPVPAAVETAPGPGPASAPDKVPESMLALASTTLGLARKTVVKLMPARALIALARESQGAGMKADLPHRLRTIATDALFELLNLQGFNQTAVAAQLDVSRTTLIKLMDDLGFKRAADLDADVINRAMATAAGDLEAAARALRVSHSALRKRLASMDSDG